MRAEDENLLEQMFDNKRQYQIPVYQRNYDWRKDHCLELFNDVVEAYKNSKSHFLGSMASNNYVPKDATSTLLSFDKDLLRTPKEIGNTGIYIETNKSSNDIVRTIKKLLEEFDLGYDDFIFYVE